MNKNRYLESLRKRLEKEKEERFRLFVNLRKYVPEIVDIAKEFDLERLVLFGSITDKERFGTRSDIDIGVIGLKAEHFFKFYSRLTEHIHWPIDLVDLDHDPKFKSMILGKGEIIYDRGNNR